MERERRFSHAVSRSSMFVNGFQGMVATQEYKEAESSFQAVLRLEPANKAAHSQIRHCRQLLKAQKDKEKRLYAKMFSKMGQL